MNNPESTQSPLNLPAVIAATLWRVAAAGKDVPRAERVGLLMSAVHGRTRAGGARAGGARPGERTPRQGERTLSQ